MTRLAREAALDGDLKGRHEAKKYQSSAVVSVVVPAVRSFSSHPLKMDQKQASPAEL